jgi:hypothetical protein
MCNCFSKSITAKADSTYITVGQRIKIVNDRIALDSLKARNGQLLAITANLEQAQKATNEAFAICNQKSILINDILAKQKTIDLANKSTIKHWKRRLIWTKIKMPIVAITAFYLGFKI